MQTQPLADASCFASARRWRSHAEELRDNAEADILTTGQRTTLLREADAAEQQADRWLDAIGKQ